MATYPKIELLLLDGSTLIWQDTQIIKADLVEEIQPISATLPISILEATIYDPDNEFSIFDEDSYFSERQPLTLYEVINGMDYLLGQFYLDDWKTLDEHTLEIRAIDVVGVLDTTSYDGHFWSSLTSIGTILKSIFLDLDIEYDLAESLETKTLKGWIPPGSCRDALQQICFAAGATVISARNQVVKIVQTPIPYRDLYHELDFGRNDKFMVQPVEKKPLVTGVEIIAHNYSAGDTEEVIYEDTLTPGTYKIIFEKPYYNITVTGAGYIPTFYATEDDEIIVTQDDKWLVAFGEFEYGPNSVYLNVLPPGGEVVVSGYPWVDSQRSYRYDEEGISSYASKNVLTVNDATLVSNNNAEAVLGRMRDYYRQRYTQSMMIVPNIGTRYNSALYKEALFGWAVGNVRIGQIVSVETLQGTFLRAVLEKASINLAGGYLLSLDAIGVIKE